MEINGITIDGMFAAGIIFAVVSVTGLITVYICEIYEKEYNNATRVVQIVLQFLGLISIILISLGTYQS